MLPLDVTAESDMARMAAATLDGMVASTSWFTGRHPARAGGDAGTVAPTSPEWDEVVDTNLRGTYLADRAVLRRCSGPGAATS